MGGKQGTEEGSGVRDRGIYGVGGRAYRRIGSEGGERLVGATCCRKMEMGVSGQWADSCRKMDMGAWTWTCGWINMK